MRVGRQGATLTGVGKVASQPSGAPSTTSQTAISNPRARPVAPVDRGHGGVDDVCDDPVEVGPEIGEGEVHSVIVGCPRQQRKTAPRRARVTPR